MATCPTCLKKYPDGQESCPDDGEHLLPDEVCKTFDEELAPGTLVGDYRIEEKIGEGGFGRVYRALHPVIGKRAAVKVLNREYSSNPNVVSRFVSEARAVNQIRHRNIIDIFAFGGLPDGRQYLVMEFLDGTTLDEFLKTKGRLSVEEALPLFRSLAKALDAAHAAGIAHRDLKPENVFLARDDEGGVYPKLLDFGIAKLLGDSAAGHKTRTGAAMGTPLYMSPEQCRGKGVDHRTDIYSFGVMVHECLTGRLPFDGDSMMDLMFKHAQQPPPPMSAVLPELSPALDAPILAMLEKDAGARPQTLVAAVDALAEAARSVGISVRDTATGSGLRLTGEGAGTKNSAQFLEPTVAAPPATAATSAGTVNTLGETAPPSNGRTIAVAAAALVIGIGATLFLTHRSGGEESSGETKPTAPATIPDAPSAVASEAPTPPAPEPSVAPSASAEASASTAAPAVPPPPPPVGPQPKAAPSSPPAAPPPAAPPPVAPPPPPSNPDGLSFDD
ncbi:MAG: serine/threonine-protein kinase [Polyangiaceae bacterium]